MAISYMHKNLVKFGRAAFELCGADRQTDGQTNRHSHHHNTVHPSRGRNNNMFNRLEMRDAGWHDDKLLDARGCSR